MDQKETDFDVIGRLSSLNVLVAMAIAIASRTNEDPRGAAFEVISATEAEMAKSFDELKANLAPADLDKLKDSAAHTTRTVGAMVDSFLASMGAPPRNPE